MAIKQVAEKAATFQVVFKESKDDFIKHSIYVFYYIKDKGGMLTLCKVFNKSAKGRISV